MFVKAKKGCQEKRFGEGFNANNAIWLRLICSYILCYFPMCKNFENIE